jgi:hypothetical protein
VYHWSLWSVNVVAFIQRTGGCDQVRRLAAPIYANIIFVSSNLIGCIRMAALVRRTGKGDAHLNSELERDFRNHQQMLLALLKERKNLADGSPTALELEKQIGKVQSVVRSYQTVKWYEQGVREKPTGDPGACNRPREL